ncbi:CpsD/CapB family tyrosine-protein kinase [Aerococcaceae bacterium DSM 111020]|nr:CpsD/CapB family tyrosine-protein kinase [Aerococcaceae bacterium DSM 111020]
MFGNRRSKTEQRLLKEQALGSPLIAAMQPQSLQAEQFRTIRTNVEFAQFGKNTRSFMVTSSIPAEGKSTISANLALIIAQTGKNVLLVDADLRKPTVHRTFQLSNEIGLTTLLMNPETPFNHAVKRIADWDIFVLPSGSLPPNPAELLGSAQMHHLKELFEENFDVIIYDVAPLNAVSDPQILATHIKEVVLVSRYGYVKKDEVKKAVQALEQVDANILGYVLNNKPVNDGGEYGYGYGYINSEE